MNKRTYTKIVGFVVVAALIICAVLLTRSASRHPETPENPQNTAYYYCNKGKTITAEFYESKVKPVSEPGQPPIPDGKVVLKTNDGLSTVLVRTISADGARYANSDESLIFWGKGNGALILENNELKNYLGCVRVESAPTGSNLSQIYANGSAGFSLRYPEGYTVDEKYAYQALGPGKDISGIKFTIPASEAKGTNLGTDAYVSVEQIPNVTDCSAKPFVSAGAKMDTVVDNGTTYSMATIGDAGAGNRYDETVYAIPGTNPCMAVRYFVHYAAFQNFTPGSVKEFDEKALTNEFDQIRRTILINQ